LELVDLDHGPNDPNGAIVARYEYDPFGKITAQSGPYADENPFRFSTKYVDAETGLSYFGYRYYSPSLGRWLNRDPAEELGGVNLYAFAGNDPIDRIDPFGEMYKLCPTWPNCPAGDANDFNPHRCPRKGSDLLAHQKAEPPPKTDQEWCEDDCANRYTAGTAEYTNCVNGCMRQGFVGPQPPRPPPPPSPQGPPAPQPATPVTVRRTASSIG
jgi:RHS repeat-associated protein